MTLSEDGQTLSGEWPLTNVRSLDPLFRPANVAVIGASRKRGTIGAEIFANLLRNDFAGAAYPVNPNARVVQSVRTYPSVQDVPDDVDLAVVVVPAAHVLKVVQGCADKGVKGLIVITAGFKEVGEAGARQERELVRIARSRGMRMIGPNCLGVINTAADVRLNATFAPTHPPAGNVAFVSQSGALGVAILDEARNLGIGISMFCSVGNKADVSGNDLLEYFDDDPRTRVILMYLESFGNPRRFSRIARRVARNTPVVVVKSGRSTAGSRAAASHTGALAGADAAVDAIFHQTGVIRVDTVSDLFAMAMLLSSQPVPGGRRVAILTNAGGPGILAADACETNGLQVPTFTDATQEALRAFLPPEASVRNPVDMIASADAASYGKAARILLDDADVDALLAIFVPPITGDTAGVARAVVDGATGSQKPVVCTLMGTHGVVEGEKELRHGGVPSYPYPTGAAIALARAAEYGDWLRKPEGVLASFSDVSSVAGRGALQGGVAPTGWLAPERAARVLAAYGIRHADVRRVPADPTAAAEAAREIIKKHGCAVALKVSSSSVVHKTDVGGVLLDLPDAGAVYEAARMMLEKLGGQGLGGAVEGLLVEQMVPSGVEVIVGMTHDPMFGPLLMFGMGGVQVELLRDVAFRINPLTDVEAREMIRSVKGFPLLDGYRGAPAADVAALEELMLRVSQLVDDLPEILEMDLNPVKVLPDGRGAVVVDVRMKLAGNASQPAGDR